MWSSRTHPSPAVLGATVAHQDSEASYWLLADIQQPITAPRQLSSRGRWRCVLRASLPSCCYRKSGGSGGERERARSEKRLIQGERRSISVALSGTLRNSVGHTHTRPIITVLSECCYRTNTNRRRSVTAKGPVLPFITIHHARQLDAVVSVCVYEGGCVSAAFVFHLTYKVQHPRESLNQPPILMPRSCACVTV